MEIGEAGGSGLRGEGRGAAETSQVASAFACTATSTCQRGQPPRRVSGPSWHGTGLYGRGARLHTRPGGDSFSGMDVSARGSRVRPDRGKDERRVRSPTAARCWRRPGLALALLLATLGCQRTDQSPSTPAASLTFVSGTRCTGCHPNEAESFGKSHHVRAMEVAGERTVLGDFGNARFTQRGATSTFFRREGRFLVRTEGPDGKPGEFEIAYTFGFTPLQQYLVPFPDGRLQALGVAWDSRPRSMGGQRWFSLYADRKLSAGDPLHWTGREQTWNFQCAECHSTDLRKSYDLAANRYATRWGELTVACEACHGPGSAHVVWAEARAGRAPPRPDPDTGLAVRLGRPEGAWTITDRERSRGVEWRGGLRTTTEVEMCARCHARRRPIVDPYPYGRPLLDTHVPALLDAPLYHADGQILGEVYEYGSFVQSRMFRAGVTCSDCHEPHSGQLRAPGNALCAQCHLPASFDTPAHHHHRAEAEAARCVSCHMTARTYMRVDPRRDHSFRVPRPDLSAAIGTPNACTSCHRDRPATWAAERLAAWSAPGRTAAPHFGLALDAGRRGLPTAERALVDLAADGRQPAIARATALALLPEFLTPASMRAVEAGLADPDGLVRMAALTAIEALPPDRRAALAGPRLRDPVRAVRLAAARVLAGTPRQTLVEGYRADRDHALAELIQSELVNAERPEAHLNLANLHARLGRPADAESALRTALRLDPRFIPALVSMADLFRAQGRDADGEHVLLQALGIAPDDAEALHALGLLRVRQGRRAEAVELLRRAAAARPDSVRFSYVYAVALQSAANLDRAVRVLEEAHRRRPADRDVLLALTTYVAERGDARAALGYAEELASLVPDDGDVRRLVEFLRRRVGGG